ncbi:hypothetical protein PUR28_34610 [Streptomyces sp. BE308]|uniref:hypothetical protein n=1 Tax=unclassified Streptomyces TaxID=2593676 RepID=UPI002DD873F5|nr:MULTISPECIES: hypothetical protein [unclassified Streptomyces]MEE1795855.1 hypothetical protein [Streptomyces sp. BE308]WRZ72352.1 hypothetical protein OG251_12350 [Streptomyces sp. NBC_01237]
MSLSRHLQASTLTVLALVFAAPVIALSVPVQSNSAAAAVVGTDVPAVVTPNDMSWQ